MCGSNFFALSLLDASHSKKMECIGVGRGGWRINTSSTLGLPLG